MTGSPEDGRRPPSSSPAGVAALTEDHRCDVVVVGAGVAGLTAAHDLVAAGRSVVVHEARPRVGGRLRSVPDGGAVDLGATWFWPGEPLVQALTHRLGLGTFPQALAGDAVFEADRQGVRRVAGNPVDVPSSRFAAGAQALATRLAEQLPEGSVRLDDPVTRVVVEDEGVTVEAASGRTRAAQVVVAVPPALAVDTIAFDPPLPGRVRDLAAATAVWMGGIVKAVAVYDRPFWRDAGLAGSAVSHVGPFREVHDHSGPGGSPAALFGFSTADQHAARSPEQIGAAFRAQLGRLFGPQAVHPRGVHVVDWSRERRTSPRAPSPHASTRTYGHPLFAEPVAGRVHWASTETSPENPGHVEGAIHAGQRAARAIGRADGSPAG